MVSKKSFPVVLILILMILQVGCSQSAAEKRDEAINSALIALSTRNCDKAISVLTSGIESTYEARYVRTLASAYACKAGFSQITFFADDLALMTSPAPMGGLATMSISDSMDSYDAASFTYLQQAIDLLLYANGEIALTQNPTVQLRAAIYSSREAGNINAQLMYMIITQLGMYFRYYANADALGVKGAGTASNGNACFIKYENLAGIDAFLLANGGACVGAGEEGHIQLGNTGVDGSYQIDRMCQAVVLFNNLRHILPEVIGAFAGSTEVGDLTAITNAMNQLETDIQNDGLDGTLADVLTVKSQTLCESQNAADDDAIQYFFAYVFEQMIQ